MGQLQRISDELDDAGWRIVAVSPDAPDALAGLASKTSVEFTLLSDQDLAAASAYGVTFRLDDDTRVKYEKYGIPLIDAEGAPRPTLPVPSVFLVVDGTVRFRHADPNYRSRIDPDVLLSAARAASDASPAEPQTGAK